MNIVGGKGAKRNENGANLSGGNVLLVEKLEDNISKRGNGEARCCSVSTIVPKGRAIEGDDPKRYYKLLNVSRTSKGCQQSRRHVTDEHVCGESGMLRCEALTVMVSVNCGTYSQP
jgi:hypothetical protein